MVYLTDKQLKAIKVLYESNFPIEDISELLNIKNIDVLTHLMLLKSKKELKKEVI